LRHPTQESVTLHHAGPAVWTLPA